MAPRVTIDIANINTFVRTDPGMKQTLRDSAERIMDNARQIAPTHTFAYVRKFRVQPFRNQYRVWNDDPFAGMVELGSRNNPVYAPIRKAVRATGFRFKETARPESTG